jgi:hypothetical protein
MSCGCDLCDVTPGVPESGTAAVHRSKPQQALDRAQAVLGKLRQMEMPLVHRFTPGLYVREIFMPKGTLVISRTHKTEHPFVVSQGHASVWSEEGGLVEIKAPHCGITKPGTRRILLIREDCIWTTFHPTNETDPEKIVEQVTEPIEPVTLNDQAVRYMLEKVAAMSPELLPEKKELN